MRNNSQRAREAVTGKMTVGMDLGDQHSYCYSLDDAGQNVGSGRVKTRREGMEKRFGGGEPMRVASLKIARMLKAHQTVYSDDKHPSASILPVVWFQGESNTINSAVPRAVIGRIAIPLGRRVYCRLELRFGFRPQQQHASLPVHWLNGQH